LEAANGESSVNVVDPGGLDRDYLTTGSVLVVDDDAAALCVLEDLLSMSGFRVFTASEGDQAVRVFSDKHPDLVITDIWMPQLDGLELLKRVRQRDDAVPVILVTGHGDLDNALLALRRGAYDFLLKPINTEILLNAVRKAMEHRRLKRFEREYRRLLEDQVAARTEELATTNELLKGILDSSTGVSIVLTDFDHRVVFWNTGAEKIYGYSDTEMVGSTILKLMPENSAAAQTYDELRNMVMSRSCTVQRNIEQQAKDGRTLTISLAVSPMVDASGKISGILGLGQDVTTEVHLNKELIKSLRQIHKIQNASIFALAKLVESRDGETAFHLKRLQAYCRVLCEKLAGRPRFRAQMSDQFMEDLVQCSVLHDIGKVAIPDWVLFTPHKFGHDEREIMKEHAITGGLALEEAAGEAGEDASYLFVGRDVAYYHHEHWDGTGYPKGLKGKEIPLAARIVAIADVYDALTTERRYKNAFSHDEAVRVILREKGRKFDPELVDAFLEVESEFCRVRDDLSNSEAFMEIRESASGSIA